MYDSINYSKMLVSLFLMFVMSLLVLSLLGQGIIGMDHANNKHSESSIIRTSIQRGTCAQKEVWYAPTSGRLLLLCQVEQNKNAWGGWVLFISENNGINLLDTPHEATVFLSTEEYWRGVIKRDRYASIFIYPTMIDHVTDTLGFNIH